MLDVRRLRLLSELHARGTIAAVADALSYTPSAVSQQLAALEREAGVPLLEKVGRGVRLTEPARRLVAHAEAVLARLERAEAELAAATGEARGQVRIVGFQTAVGALIAPSIRTLTERHPQLRPEVIEMEAEEALPLLRSGDADVVLAEEYDHAPRPRDPAYERIPLCEDPIRFVLPPNHPAAGRRAVKLADLRDDVWATARENTAFADMLLRVCRSRGGFEPDIRHRANDIRLLTQLAASGLAVSLAPGLGRPEAEAGIVVRDAEDSGMTRHIFAAVRAGSATRPSVAAVLDALHEQVSTLELG